MAEASKRAAEEELITTIVTPIEAAGPFFPAEAYHQDYYKKAPLRYRYYRWSCGRNQRVKEVWGRERVPGYSRPRLRNARRRAASLLMAKNAVCEAAANTVS